MARDVRAALRITRLQLSNWRNFRSVDVHLEKRAVFVGPNAAGKSNLLDAVRFLGEVARPGHGGLKAALDTPDRGGFSQVRCLHARNPSDIVLDATVGKDDAENIWQYRLKFNQTKKEQYPKVVEEQVYHYGNIVSQQRYKNGEDTYAYQQTLLENVGSSQKFRELAEFFSSCRYLHIVPQILRDRRRAPVENDPYGGDLLRRMKEVPERTRVARLNRISKALSIAVPQFVSLKLSDDTEGIPHLYAGYQHWRKDASLQSEVAFSDGTLRLIGLLWSIAEPGGPLLLEEPELSLNDTVVSELPAMFARMQRFSGRQVIITTHSNALIADPGLGLKEVHRITVGENGSGVETAAENRQVAAQVKSGMTIAEAVLPLLRPKDVEQLRQLQLAV